MTRTTKATPLVFRALKLQAAHPTKNLLLIYLADYWSEEKGAYPTQTSLAKRCGCSRKHVNEMLGEMVRDGWIFMEDRFNADGSRTSSKYTLNPAMIGVTVSDRGVTDSDRGVTDSDIPCNPELQTPVTVSYIKSPLVKTQLISTPIVPSAFDRFYEAYPKKTGRREAQKAWDKLSPQPALVNRIMRDIVQRVEQGAWCTGEGKQYIPGPAPYLNQHRWEDEIIPRPEFKPTKEFNFDNIRDLTEDL